MGRCWLDLKSMDFNGFGVKFQPLLFVDQELLDIFALITLKLDHLTHLRIINDGAITSEFLLDNLEYLFLVELFGQPLNSSQGLATIALLDPDMDVILRLLGFPSVFVGFGEGVEGLEIFDGHKLVCSR